MEERRIKWGNILIFLLIIAAAVAAFYYKNPLKPSQENDVQKKQESRNDNADRSETKQNETGPSGNELVLGLDSWIGGTPALVALSREYHKDYMLDLKLEYIPNDGDRIKALKEGKIQATEMSLPSFIKFQGKMPGSGIIVGITDFSRGADGIVAKSEVKNLNDMEDKNISFVANGTGKFILNKFLRLTGLRYQDINPIERSDMKEVVDDLKSGKADMIVSWSPDMNVATKEINAAKPGSVRLLITTKEVPNLVPTVLVFNKDFYSNNQDKALDFLKTWYVSSKYVIERPEKAYDKLVQLMNENKDNYGEVALDDVKESFDNIKLMSLNDNFSYFGVDGSSKELEIIIKDTVQTWRKYGDIAKDVDPGEVYSVELMQRLFKENDKELLVDALDPSLTGRKTEDTENRKDFKKQDDVSIEENTEKVAKIDIPPVYYDSGKATVKPESIPVLNEVLTVLKQFPEYYLIIDAHTDSVGSEEANLKLSKDRAGEVSKYLVSQGVEVNRVVARGWGEAKPVVVREKNEDDRSKNRRTEFILTRDASN